MQGAKMSFLLLKNCCFCVDLRVGSFMIGYLMLFLRVSAMITTSVRMSSTGSNGMLHYYSIEEQDYAFHRLTGIISLMILTFELLLCLALLVGLHKRLDQHVEMYYVGSLAFLVMGVILYSAVLLRYAEKLGVWTWLLVALEVVMKLILIYFLAVIRSYYYKMKDEEKGDQEELAAREAAKTYFARTKPVLFNSKPV